MKLIKDYMRDDVLRHELNELTREVFCFDFENWVTGGGFEGDYIPYSYEEDGHLVANASVNRMEFLQNGEVKHYIQIGTVMTKEEYRNQGYAAKLIKQIIAEYHGNCDGIYLFGNLSALGFYDKLGFARGIQYRYSLKKEEIQRLRKSVMEQNPEECFRKATAEHRESYRKAVRNSAANSALEQSNKFGLQMFYTAGMENVYYCQTLNCYIVMEVEERTLYLQSVIAPSAILLEDIISRIDADYDTLMLGFAPRKEDAGLCTAEAYDGAEDYRFFYLGDSLKGIEEQKLYFPELSHA